MLRKHFQSVSTKETPEKVWVQQIVLNLLSWSSINKNKGIGITAAQSYLYVTSHNLEKSALNIPALFRGQKLTKHRGQGAAGVKANTNTEPSKVNPATTEAFPIKKGNQQLQAEPPGAQRGEFKYFLSSKSAL